MGSTASVDMSKDAKYAAFLALKESYELDKMDLAQATPGTAQMSDQELLAIYQQRFLKIANSKDARKEVTSSEREIMMKRDALHARLSNDEASLTRRGICVGDIVKVMDDGFWVEGVVVSVIDRDNLLIDFGLEELTTLDVPMPLAPTAEESSGHQDDDDDDVEIFGEMKQPGPLLRGGSDGVEKANGTGNGNNSNSYGKHVMTTSNNVSTKLVKADECMLVMPGEELEVGDKVEICTKDSFLYCVGYIWKIHRKFDVETSSVLLTYDVHMDGTGEGGEAIGSRYIDSIEDRIQLYEDKLRDNESTEEWDLEYAVEPKNIRKLLSGRIKALDRWKSAWRKVTAMLAFKTSGKASPASGSGSGGGGAGGMEASDILARED